jgi:hypothetical protein
MISICKLNILYLHKLQVTEYQKFLEPKDHEPYLLLIFATNE